MKKVRVALIAAVALAAISLAACGGGGGSTAAPAGSMGAAGATSAAPTSTESESAAADTGEIVITAPPNAASVGFEPTTATAPADTPFTITFENKDPGIPHNIKIYEGTDTSKDPVFEPKNNALVTGTDDVKYEIQALAPGTYTYVCSVHPATMMGTLTAA